MLVFSGIGDTIAGILIGDIQYRGESEGMHWVREEKNSGLGNVAVMVTPDEKGEKGEKKITSSPDKTKRIHIIKNIDKMYKPHMMVVAKGSTIIHRNADPFSHAPMTESSTKMVPIHLHNQGDQKKEIMEEVGITKLICKEHNKGVAPMVAYIVVTDAPYFSKTNRYGRFTIRNIPKGTYTVNLWHEGLGEMTKTVNVRGYGKTYVVLPYE